MSDLRVVTSASDQKRRWLIALAFPAVYLIWGSTYLAIRFALETLPPLLMAAFRFLLAGAVLYGWSRLRGRPRPNRAEWAGAGAVGALLLLGGNGGVVWAQQRVPSGLAALLIAMVPVWVVLLEWVGPRPVRLGEPARAVQIGVLGGFAGVALLLGPSNLTAGRIDPLGAVVLIGAALMWAIGSVIARRLPQPPFPILTTGMQMLVGGALLAVAGVLAGEPGRIVLEAVSIKSVLAVAYLLVFGSLVGFTAYVFLLKEVAVSKVATYAYVNPLVALLLGWGLAGEALSTRVLWAAAVILGSVVLITTARKPTVAPSRPVSISGVPGQAEDETGVATAERTLPHDVRRCA